MGLVSMKSNLTWIGPSTNAPGKMPLEKVQNKITSYQEESIREQYDKFLIYDTPNINRLSFGRATDQPFIIRGIQRRGGDVQFYGPGGRTSPQNMMVRGGLIAFAARLAEDAVRMSKFMISPKGIIWNLKQVGLQASNPNVESTLPIRPTKSYNPLALAKNIITAPNGIHSARHGSRVTTGRYEDVQKQLLQTDASNVTANRLARLKVELFGTGAPSAVDQEQPTDLFGRIVQGISNFVEPLQNALTSFDGSEISELSGPGGPKSVFGIGYTSIRRTVTSGTVLKEQGGPHHGKAFWGIHYSPITKYESEATPGAPRTLEDSGAPGNSIEKTYQPKKDSNYPSTAFIPNRDAETGGHSLLNITERFSFESLYLESNSPVGGRYVGSEPDVESIDRPLVDTQTGLVGEGRAIIEGTPDSSNELFPMGEKYLESFTAAQNKSREEGIDDNPGGGRYVGSSPDGSEETHQRAKNSADKNLLDHAHKYHVYQNRDAAYPEGYYNIANANSGPRGKPVGGSKHNIYQSLDDEANLVRTLVDGKKIIEHVHSFIGEGTQGIQTNNPSTQLLNQATYTFGYVMRVLNGGQVYGEDWDAQDRVNLYQLIDPILGDASNKNTPQIRKSADRVFEPGSPVGYKPNPNTLISSKDVSGLNAVKVGEAIFNYFTPDLKFFTGNTREQIDDGGPHDYKSLKQKYGLLEAGDEFGNVFNYVYGLDNPDIVPTYNSKLFGSIYTPSNPKVGASPDSGQQAISGQTSRQVLDVDVDILAKLDPLQNEKARPDELGSIKQIGGKPKSSAGTPLVYNYMNYSEIRNAAKQGGVLNPGKIQEFRRAVTQGIANEIQSRNRTALGYGGAKQVDSLNALPVGGSPGKDDLVPFYLSRYGGSQALYFRAGINSVSDAFSPEWSQEKEIGRADPKVLLTGFGRTISLDLTLAAGSADELQPMWDKLNVLAGWTAPTYVGNGYRGTFIEITLGNMYEAMPCYLTSFGVDWDNETPWEITPGRQMPKYANVTIEVTYVGSSIPTDGSKFFGLAADRGQNPSAGANTPTGDFDAIDNLIEDAPDGVSDRLGAPYNMAKDLAGDLVDGAKDNFNSAIDFLLPGDQSGDNAASSQIAGVASKAYAGAKEGGKKIINFLNPFD